MTASTVPSKPASASSECFGADHIEVVSGLVEEEQCRSGQLQQQDLEAGLLPARQGTERLVRLLLQAIPT